MSIFAKIVTGIFGKKSEKDLKLIHAALKDNLVCRALQDSEMTQLIDALVSETINSKASILPHSREKTN